MAARTCVLLALLLAACGGCASRARAAHGVPRLDVVIRASQSADTRVAGPSATLEWRGLVRLAWRPGRGTRDAASSGRRAMPTPRKAPRRRVPCVSPPLCAWERRARAHVLREVLP